MRSIIIIILLSLFAISAVDASQRTSRRIVPQDKPNITPQRIAEADDLDSTLFYGEWDTLDYIWTIPDVGGYGDKYYNVRFTPPEDIARFTILEAHIPLFDLFGDKGEPGMRVIAWQSGDQGDYSGYPDEQIDSVDVPYESLKFSSVSPEGNRIIPVLNVIDLRDLDMSFNGVVDFHLGVDVISSDTTNTDSLALVSDDGDDDPTDRSILWNGGAGEWTKLEDIRMEGRYRGFNFAIRVLIETSEGVTEVLYPTRNVPETVSIKPAFPNPFNSQTRFEFNVKHGLPYNLMLTDPMGRKIRTLATGVGKGDDELNLIGAGLPAGVFYIQLTAGGSTAARQINYIK